MSELCRIGVKFFFRTGREVPLVDFIPVFHRWIQTSAVDGLLIDVADYSHVPEGPGIILVAHEGIYSVDETLGRRGLAYARRRPFDGSVDDCLNDVLKSALHAAQLLERDFAGVIAFKGDEFELFINDRLLAPNEDATVDRLMPHVDGLVRRLYPSAESTIVRDEDPRQRFSLAVTTPTLATFEELAGRICR